MNSPPVSAPPEQYNRALFDSDGNYLAILARLYICRPLTSNSESAAQPHA